MNQPGIVYHSASPNGDYEKIYLPLEQVRARVIIVDTSARVTLTQTFSNMLETATGRSKFCFPVPENAALCAFYMRTSDGHIITGIIKEKEQARKEFEEADNNGNVVGLLDYVSDDIFTISLGSISAYATVETNVVYVMSLGNDNIDETRFQLPMSIGQRYGDPPQGLSSAVNPGSRTRVRITIDIQTSGRIHKIISPSHANHISVSRYPTDLGRESRRRATVRFRSQLYLACDFVLTIHAEGLDTPRCFAELKRDPEGRVPDTIAMQLSIVPKFNLPQINAQEYFFVVDRSGSMEGARIDTAKRTLAVLLRMLPSRGTMFNIYSFGNNVDGLWATSCVYDRTSLDQATIHVDSMEANYGGTEIRAALVHVLHSCSRHVPTAVYVLTDGEAHDISETTKVVRGAVQGGSSDGPIRVFTLGIGNTVSSAMCEGIARAGNGVCLFAADTETILAKCARLFNAGRTPFVRKVTVDWDIADGQLGSSVHFSHPATSPRTVEIHPLPAIQQAPTRIGDIHAGSRTNIYAILTLKGLVKPKAVTLRGELDDGSGSNFEMTIPIREIKLAGVEDGLPLVHTLAAWRLIQEYEEEQTPLPLALTLASDDEIRKAVIIHLGEKYQLITRYTSFIADSRQDNNDRTWRRPLRPSRSSSQLGGAVQDSGQPEDNGLSRWAGFRSIINGFILSIFRAGEVQGTSEGVPGEWPDRPLISHSDSESGADDDGYESNHTFSTLSSLEGSNGWSEWSPLPSPEASPRLVPASLCPEDEYLLLPPKPSPVRPPTPPPMKTEVVEVVRLQLYDGSVSLNDSLRNIIGANAVNEANNLQVDDKVWGTALFIAFIKKHMGTSKELLDDLLVKAYEYLNGSNVDVKGLISLAESAL